MRNRPSADYRARPRARFWLVTGATLVGVLVTASLGHWQLSRAAEKEALQTAIERQARTPALDARSLLATEDLSSVLYRPVHLRGLWVHEHTVYLDNRQMHGQPGFFVVTPLAIEGTAQVVLVQRGWMPRNFIDRSALQAVPTPAGVVEVDGVVAPAPSRLYEFAGEERGPIRQNLDLPAFAAETQLPLWRASVQQTSRDGAGLLRDWPVPNAGVAKHYGYAFQWFGLAALLTGLYVWFQFVRRPAAAGRTPHA